MFNARGFVFVDVKLRSFSDQTNGRECRDNISRLLSQYNFRKHKSELSIIIDFHYKHSKRLDIDNTIKIVLDSMQGIVFEDDCQIRRIAAEVHEHSGIEGFSFRVSKYRDKTFFIATE